MSSTAEHLNLKIAAIIVGYNSKDYLADCFSSLAVALKKYEHRIYFFDNASTDASVTFVKETFTSIHVTQSPQNVGFAQANNLAIQQALSDGYTTLLIINPDTVIDPTCITELVAHYSSDTILQPLILLHKDGAATDIVNTAGNPLHYLGFSYAGSNSLPVSAVPSSVTPIPLASGACMLVPAHIIETIGAFDATFFMYDEDADLSWRARLAGFSIKLVPSAKVWHKYHFSRNSVKFYFAERNRLIFLAKNFQVRTLILISPMMVLTELFMVLYAALNGWGIKKITSTLAVLGFWNHIKSERTKIHKLRTVTDKQLYQFLTDRLVFSEMDSLPIKLYNLGSLIYWRIVKYL